jgi:hypothetical protein
LTRSSKAHGFFSQRVIYLFISIFPCEPEICVLGFELWFQMQLVPLQIGDGVRRGHPGPTWHDPMGAAKFLKTNGGTGFRGGAVQLLNPVGTKLASPWFQALHLLSNLLV